MVWALGAEILAGRFGEDFSDLLVDGESPFGRMSSWPSSDEIGLALGMAPRYSICEAFGRGPGLAGVVAKQIGMPRERSDAGADEPANP